MSRLSRVSQITSSINPLNWLPENCYLSGQDEGPPGTREDHRRALRDNNYDSLFAQLLLNFVKVRLQVADEQRPFA